MLLPGGGVRNLRRLRAIYAELRRRTGAPTAGNRITRDYFLHRTRRGPTKLEQEIEEMGGDTSPFINDRLEDVFNATKKRHLDRLDRKKALTTNPRTQHRIDMRKSVLAHADNTMELKDHPNLRPPLFIKKDNWIVKMLKRRSKRQRGN